MATKQGAFESVFGTFSVKIQTEENDYLGCEFLVSEDKKKGWLGQPHMIKSLLKKFGFLIEKVQTLKTAGTLGFITIKPEEEEN